jgi:hypothetical protein
LTIKNKNPNEKNMKTYLLTTLTLIATTSCASNTGTGVIAASTFGATIGSISANREGALIGGAIGVVTGALVGHSLDVQDRRVMQKASPRTVDRMEKGEPLTISDVIKLSQNGVSDAAIIEYMDDCQTEYQLTQTQVRRLESTGVSQRVIEHMLQTAKN